MTVSRSSQVPLSVVHRSTYPSIRHCIPSDANLFSRRLISVLVFLIKLTSSFSIKGAMSLVVSWLRI